MFATAVLATALLGQVYYEPVTPTVYVQPVVVRCPTTFITLQLGTMTTQTRYDATVGYDGKCGRVWKTVPVINGIVPVMHESPQSNGDLYLVYDYRIGIPYESALRPGIAPQSQPTLPPKLPPRMEPVPDLKPLAPLKDAFDPPPLPKGMKRPNDVSEPSQVILPSYRKD